MTAARNVYGKAFQYSAILDRDVYGNVREWKAVVVADAPQGGWTVRVGERVWYPQSSVTVFQVRNPQSSVTVFNVRKAN
jgi:hypothetical protein